MRYAEQNMNSQPEKMQDGPALLARAWQLRNSAHFNGAEKACRTALSLNPQFGQAWHLLGIINHDQGNPVQAVAHLKQAVAVEPGEPMHYNNLGVVLHSMGRFADAETVLSNALKIAPDYYDARCNLGLALYFQNDFSKAARCFLDIIDSIPGNEAALSNLGMTRLAQQRYTEAATLYEQAIAIDSGHPQWHGNLAAAYMRLARFDKAAACYRQASQLASGNTEYLVRLGIALRAAGSLSESIRVLERTVSVAPNHTAAIANLVVGLEYTCQWGKLELYHPLLGQSTQSALAKAQVPDEDPMMNIRRSCDVKLNQAVGRAWSRSAEHKARRVANRFSHLGRTRKPGRITIGYLSYDFRNHPVAHQLSALFRLHDRNQFRVICFSMGPDDGSCYRKEIIDGCDEFINIDNCGLAEAARIIYDRQVDILVDLMGHSHHNRLEILALKPAPVQVAYLGFLSTTGADFMDYIVTDPVVVPENHTPFYEEKMLRMPNCYQFNHLRGMKGKTRLCREDCGLPSNGFIFCCFNTVYKIDRSLFDTWMRILLHTSNSFLWLNGSIEAAAEQMRARAADLGIDPHRLVFAEKLQLADHLERLPLADLALDTVRYNGGATTANALAAGVPVITIMGRHWVSRMSASHLLAVGLPDLVVQDLESYEKNAIELANRPEKLAKIRNRLSQNIKTSALFDAPRFVRHLEAGFKSAWARYLNGLRPGHIDIATIDIHAGGPDSPAPPVNKKKSQISQAPLVSETAVDHSHSNTIYYFCPDKPLPSAGIRRIYRHASVLHNAGFDVFVLHEKNGFQIMDMPRVPIASLERIEPDRNAVFVIPEGMPKIMYRLKDHPGRRFAFALSWHYIFSTLPDGLDWRHFNIERVLTISQVIGELIIWSMGLPVHYMGTSIDHNRYYYDPGQKRLQIAYIARKASRIERLKSLLASRNTDYIHKFKWVGLEGMSQEDYAAEVRRSAIFLSTSMAEGFPTSSLEAMAAGAIVAGYDGVGGKDVFCDENTHRNCILAPSGDYPSLARKLAPLLDDLIDSKTGPWESMISRAQQTASSYTAEGEARSIIRFWHRFAPLQNTASHPCSNNFHRAETGRHRRGQPADFCDRFSVDIEHPNLQPAVGAK